MVYHTLDQATVRDTVNMTNLHRDDREFVYELKITGFDRFRLPSNDSVKYWLRELAADILRDKEYHYCKLLGRWRISSGSKGPVFNFFSYLDFRLINNIYIFFNT